MTLRPIAYGTGLTLSTDGKLRIQNMARARENEIVIQERPSIGGTRWSINPWIAADSCLNRDGEWEYEPQPSSRDDEFYARCRFASLDEAVEFLSRKEAENAKD